MIVTARQIAEEFAALRLPVFGLDEQLVEAALDAHEQGYSGTLYEVPTEVLLERGRAALLRQMPTLTATPNGAGYDLRGNTTRGALNPLDGMLTCDLAADCGRRFAGVYDFLNDTWMIGPVTTVSA